MFAGLTGYFVKLVKLVKLIQPAQNIAMRGKRSVSPIYSAKVLHTTLSMGCKKYLYEFGQKYLQSFKKLLILISSGKQK